ncbi:tRNA dimethylallyltransferase 9 [Vitis vinifera]|uniref:tRNA dimethylallyltransferase 9 n=1 Tax=Vitis vinifera TaxID=29760 RepID=UPI00053F5D66|nr:tRNA dimethylallyltransferase 9 [Vitis vinifera]|eukprot:XP_010653693.1 PREDICTED: tRNA dimethylallyltransferase 9 [Vitis vinifera]
MSWRVCSLRSLYAPEMPLLRSPPFFFVRSRRLFGTTCSVSGTKKKNKEKVIVISGPTGAEKSRLALELAKRLNGEIISADSVQWQLGYAEYEDFMYKNGQHVRERKSTW